MPTFLIIWLPLVVIALTALAVFRPGRQITWLVIIALIAALAIWISLPNNPGVHVDLNGDGELDIDRTIAIRQGLDLAGGLQVLLEADLPPGESPPAGALDETRRIIEQRVDSLGALEPVIQVQGDRRIIVELPGYEDPESAVELIRETAQLEFIAVPNNLAPPPGTPVVTTLQQELAAQREEAPADEEEPAIVYETVMTGSILQSAEVSYNSLQQPVVAFTLTPEGDQVFGDYTRDHIGDMLGIVLDGTLISAPVINAEIRGSGIIEGAFTVEEAERLATQLRYGALPVPLRVDSTSTVGPTLGQISITQSIRAGLIGIAVVLLFMLIYYRLPGVAAALALLLFAVLNLAIYKLLPVTMTLPAITGFLISVGTAVDGNILIFERMKEELRAGKRVDVAVRAGFDRAWASIRDSNLSTLIISFILYAFGTSFGAGAVRGFAVTLALGLLLNLFTAVIVTRTFLHFLLLPFTEETLRRRLALLGL
ncbi:MAG: protein translocase subunit SecD [Anaerolineae bacterium]